MFNLPEIIMTLSDLVIDFHITDAFAYCHPINLLRLVLNNLIFGNLLSNSYHPITNILVLDQNKSFPIPTRCVPNHL